MLVPLIRTISDKKTLYGSCICLIGAIFYCYEFVLRILPGALQSEISLAFGALSATSFGQLAAFYYFAYSPMQIPVGMLMDRYGPRRLLTFACLCCTLGSWMFMQVSSLVIASLGRFLVGFGSSFAFVGVLSLALHWLPRRYFSLTAGLITTLGMLGLVYGEIKITHIALSLGWQYVLSLAIIIGLILTLIIYAFVRDGEPHTSANQPLPEFFRNVIQVLVSPQVWLIGLVGACLYTSLSVFGELWGKTYLEQAHHLTKVDAANSISLLFLGWAIGAPIAGYCSDKTGRRILPLLLSAIFALISISLILYYPNLTPKGLNILLFFYGVFSGTEIIVFILAKETTGAQLSGTVFAAVNMIVTLGGVLFQPLVGKLLDTLGKSTLLAGERIYSTASYQIALAILPISLLIVVFCAYFLKENGTLRSKDCN